MRACEQAAMHCCAVFTAMFIACVFQQIEAMTLEYLPLVTETTTGCCVTGGATSPGIVEISVEDVERSLQQKQDIIIDVRNFDEVTEFGQIPSAHVLPGKTLS